MSTPQDPSQTTPDNEGDGEDRTSTHNPQERMADQPLRARLWYAAKQSWSALWLFAITGAVLYAIWTGREQQDDIRSLAEDNNTTLQAVQDERTRNVRESCEATNQRHDNTVNALNRVLLERLSGDKVSPDTPQEQVSAQLAAELKAADPPVRRATQQSLASTIFLIDALQPKRDCDRLVKQQVPSASGADNDGG